MKSTDEGLSVWRAWGPGAGYSFAEGMHGVSDATNRALLTGRRVRSPVPTISYSELGTGALAEALAEPMGALVTSQRLREFLEEKAQARIQFLPTKLEGTRKVYWVANVLEQVDCIDRERSRYSEHGETGGIAKLKRLVLLPLGAEGPGLFHLKGFAGIILSRPWLRRLVEADFPSAGHFVPVSKFKIGYL